MTSKELIIHASEREISIALLENGELVELNKEKGQAGFSVGNIYVGRVRKVMSGLNATFVNIGHERDAFLHYLDLGHQFNTYRNVVKQGSSKRRTFVDISKIRMQPTLKREGKISSCVSSGDLVLVQVAKEAISTKGPRLTNDISLPGRHLVLIPLSNKVSISQKIRARGERKRLQDIVEKVLPRNFGAIIRTAAEGKSDEEISADIEMLLDKWQQIMLGLQTAAAPALLLSEASRTTTILRDLLSDSFTHIHCDDREIYDEVKAYISKVEPDSEKIVKLYNGNIPIFDQFDVTKQIKQKFGRTVVFTRGAYLVVEHTEALHVIDVNSGRRAKSSQNQEVNALEVNLNAVPEIAKQLRLKDMGGIIVIDFIDLHAAANRTQVYKAMQEAMKVDRAKHNILPLTRFGLMQITRQRVRPETHIEIKETCPTCRGSGEIRPSVLLDDQIESQIAYLARDKHYKSIIMHLHPYVASHLTKGIISKRTRWALKHRIVLKIIPSEELGIIDYKFFNGFGDEI